MHLKKSNAQSEKKDMKDFVSENATNKNALTFLFE